MQAFVRGGDRSRWRYVETCLQDMPSAEGHGADPSSGVWPARPSTAKVFMSTPEDMAFVLTSTTVRCHQGWTHEAKPRSSRNDSMTQNVVLAVYISAAARTPVYFAMTGAAAISVLSSRWPFAAA